MSTHETNTFEATDKAPTNERPGLTSAIAPTGGTRTLLPEHLEELERSAISSKVAREHEVYSAHTVDDLPMWAQWIGERYGEVAFPALVYPMAELDGTVTGQVKPAEGCVPDRKYISPSDSGAAPHAPLLPLVHEGDSPKGILIVEGVKQALAASAYAPDGWSVLRICGIEGWSRKGVATPHLRTVKGLPVVVIPDADAASNHAVYKGAVRLGTACNMRGAKSVKYVRTGASGKAGLDDVLAADPEESRAEYLQSLIDSATSKPADRVPKAPTQEERDRKTRGSANAAALASGDRALVHVRGDRLEVIERCNAELHRKFGGSTLFRHGDAFGLLARGDNGPTITTVGPGELADLVAQAAVTVTGDERQDDGGCTHDHEWPDKNVLAALLSRHRNYEPLDGISRLPLVRADGSMVTKTGYDITTRHHVELSEDLEGIAVPEVPTSIEIDEARTLLLDDLLDDFLLKDESDRAHAVAALLTPLIRPLVPTAPFLVIDGLQRGVGKGLFLDVMSRIVLGRPPSLSILPTTEEEMRKTLTATLRAGDTVLIYDEVTELRSPALNSLATAERWSDRKLGASERIEIPNRASLFFAGNNVEVTGDAARRAVRIRLHSDMPDPENRSGFRHENLKAWVTEHRRELLQACLTLIRAWYAQGQPGAHSPFRFGSFERWQDTIGGILHVAGIRGFLEGVEEQRRESDYEDVHWTSHYEWLQDRFGAGTTFTSREALREAKADLDSEMPPGLEKDATARGLGKAYAGQGPRWRGGLRIVKSGTGQGGSMKWAVEASPTSAGAPPTAIQSVALPAPQSSTLLPPVTDLLSTPTISERPKEDDQ